MDFSSCRTIKDLARVLIKKNEPRYTTELLYMLPSDLKEIRLDDDGNVTVSSRLNELRFEKEQALCKLLRVDYPPTRAHDQVTYKRCLEAFGHGRPPEVGGLCVEIKFLFNVASALDHW